jgi:uncharacterized membrane protein required for colicin V production
VLRCIAGADGALLPFAAGLGPTIGGSRHEQGWVNLAEFLNSLNVFDIVVLLYLFGWFILGFIQGTVRRVVGTASIVFSFFIAAQLNTAWLGGFLAENWTQFPREYSIMIGFLTLFIAGVVAFTLVIQGTYRKAPLFADYPVVDEIIGGLVGILQGFLLLMFVTIVLDQYFLYTNLPQDPDELAILRTFWDAVNTSGTGTVLHSTAIPAFITITGFLLPDSVRALYGR